MPEKVYVHDSSEAVFVCHECGKSRTVNVYSYMKTSKPVYVTVKCTCGYQSKLLLERRNQYRKETRFPGVFVYGSEKNKGPLVVTDISLTGLGFELTDDVPFTIGENVLIEFNLDDAAKTFVRKEVVIRSVREKKIGAEFHEMDPAEGIYKALKIYLY